jgi:hypothetical protein
MILQSPVHGVLLSYQRHRKFIQNSLIAAALTLLVGLFLEATNAFSEQWRLVLLLTIFAIGAQSRDWGYYLAVSVLSYALWDLSPYFMSLFVAVALLPRLLIINYLPWALLVVSTPLLAEWQAIGLVPLLAGLIAGPTVGLSVGLLAALWLKLVAGLAGWMPELGALHGLSFTIEMIEARVSDATSLETLKLLAAPFSQSSTILLLHVLQITGFGIAGWLVGKVRQIEWRQGKPPFVLLPTLAVGFLPLWGAIYLLPAWLEIQSFTMFWTNPLPAAGLALSALTAALLSAFYENVQRPLPNRRAAANRRRQKDNNTSERSTPDRRAWSDARAQDGSLSEGNIIMLEFD